MFLKFDDVYVYVAQASLANKRARHTVKWPGGREEGWGESWDYQQAYAFEKLSGFWNTELLKEFAEHYLDWHEMPIITPLPHLEERWINGDYEWTETNFSNR